MKLPPGTGPVLRVGVMLLLCAACFQAGRWYGELKTAAYPLHAKGDPGNELAGAPLRGAPETPKTVEPAPSVGLGEPVGQTGDIITPLNVRDPSALVLGPGLGRQECPPQAAIAPDPPAKEAKPLKLKKGRLLELLKKAGEKSDLPKTF